MSSAFAAHSTPEDIVAGWVYTCCPEHIDVRPGEVLGMAGLVRADGGVDFGGWAIHVDCFPEHVKARLPKSAGAKNHPDLRGTLLSVPEHQLTMLLLAVDRLPSKQDQARELLRRMRATITVEKET